MDKDELKSSIEDIVEDLELAVSERKVSRIVNKIFEYKYESDITSDELYEDIMDIFPNEKEDDSIIEFAEEVSKMAIDKIQDYQDSEEDSEEDD